MRSEKLNNARDLYFQKDYETAVIEFQKWYLDGDIYTKIEAAYFLMKIYSILDYPIDQIDFYYNFILASNNHFYMAKAYTERGLYFRKKGDFLKMAACYLKAIDNNPYEIKALTALAFYYLTANQLDLAFDYYDNLLFVNENTIPYDRKVRNDNIAYIGLATIMIKEGKIAAAKDYLSKVKEMNTKDRENLNKCYANIAFFEENYEATHTFLRSNMESKIAKVRREAIEKEGVIYAIEGLSDNAIATLEKLQFEPIKNQYANYLLGYLYYKKGEYEKAYAANMLASGEYPKALIYALKCAMHISPEVSAKTGNLVIKNSILVGKYRPYLLYLSKQYNIFFPGLDYRYLTTKETQLIGYSKELLMESTRENCALSPDYSVEDLVNNIIPRMLENISPFKSEYCDTYVIYYPGIGLNFEDYIIVNTIKDTKDIMDIKLSTKEALCYYDTPSTLRHKSLVRNLFI